VAVGALFSLSAFVFNMVCFDVIFCTLVITGSLVISLTRTSKMLPPDQEQAIPKVKVLPWCS
jgi:NhaP-type Na+/H+ and K+/H+ antiporter